MKGYEVTFILDTALEDEALEAVIGQVRQVIADNGGEAGEADRWGKRRLAYVIAEKNEGYYVLLPFTGESKTLSELDRHLKLNEQCLRHMIIKLDE